MRNKNATETISAKQIYIEGYSPKETFLNEEAVQRLRNQLNDPRVVVGVQSIGSLQNRTEFLLLKVFLPKELLDDEAENKLKAAA